MSENWIVQYSLKDGQPMLNVRADSVTAFFETLAEVAKGYQEIALATSILTTRKGFQENVGVRPAPPPPSAPSAPQQVPAASYVSPPGAAEVGPVMLIKVTKDLFTKDKVKMKDPKYTFEFGDGKRCSTFKEIWGKAGEGLVGEMVYYSTETRESNGKTYTNLAEVRRAS